jgi:hypothetical protein
MVVENLTRGSVVVVGDTFSKEELHGAKMRVASKGTVKCNGKGRCAGDHCIGLAVFVTAPETYEEEPDGSTGWRSNTTKICLTHLQDEAGNPLVNGDTPVPAPAAEAPKKKRRGRKKKNESVLVPEMPPAQQSGTVMAPPATPGDQASVVTWEMLAFAFARKDLTGLSIYARRLMAENQLLTKRLIDMQQRIIDGLDGK